MAATCDWIVIVPDYEGALEKRLANRNDHLNGLTPRVQSGQWVMGGATVAHPPVGDEQKAFNGSCVVARATSKEEVVAQLKEDVYAKAGVWNVDAAVIHPLMSAFRKEQAGAAW